jgi:hypothetical protein
MYIVQQRNLGVDERGMLHWPRIALARLGWWHSAGCKVIDKQWFGRAAMPQS